MAMAALLQPPALLSSSSRLTTKLQLSKPNHLFLSPSLPPNNHKKKKKKKKPIPTPPLSLAASSHLSTTSRSSMRLTYLEINSWIWEVGGLSILVDPILQGDLDFGIPWLFDAAKKALPNFQVDDLALGEMDLMLITQSLDDHCHVRTLKKLSSMAPELPVVTTPNAQPILKSLFHNVTYLEPGQETSVLGKNGAQLKILATAGPVLGPPWQRPENGYVLISSSSSGGESMNLSLYYEPHCVYNKSFLEKYEVRADVVITPVVKQLISAFTLVSGQEDAVELAKLLHAKYVVPMRNGDLDTKGLLASIVSSEGTTESFMALLCRVLPEAEVLEPTPGVPLHLPIPAVSQSQSQEAAAS